MTFNSNNNFYSGPTSPGSPLSPSNELFEDSESSEKRKKRFAAHLDGSSSPIRNTINTSLEKEYLRTPDMSTLRSEPILMEALKMVKQKWREERNYSYVAEQFKSIRQDLVVQGIKSKTTAEVYQTHARIALEAKDIEEYNRCQTMLMDFYDEYEFHQRQKSSQKFKWNFKKNRKEFLAYKLLYLLYSNNFTEIGVLMMNFTSEDKQYDGISHAVQVIFAYNTNNYYQFFQLYKKSPNLNALLINFLMEPMRTHALKAMGKAFRESFPISYLSDLLSFETNQKCAEFVKKMGLSIQDNQVDIKPK